MSRDPDVVVIGGGPNGLSAAFQLARRGMDVVLLESHPTRIGGALGSEDDVTRPGFVHDVGAAFFPFGKSSPAWRGMNLGAHGLEWLNAAHESCHPAPDGTAATISRDADVTAGMFGTPADGDAWRKLARWHASVEPALLAALLAPFPPVTGALGLLPFNALRIAFLLARSGRSLASRFFSSEPARRVLPGLALHVDVGPDDQFGAGLAYMLGLTASTGGFSVPRGGARAFADALASAARAEGVQLRQGARVERVVVKGGRACGVRLADGTEIAATRAVVANTAAPALFLDLVERDYIPSSVIRFMRRFPHGFGTFKMDWALSGPVPWTVEAARASAVVHAGDSVDDLARFARQVRAGQLPENPYLVIGQQSLVDPSRAPAGQHALWAYSRVPGRMEGGWERHAEQFADRVEARIEGLAPGFRSRVLARRIVTPPDLQRMDANLVNGDLGGGSNAWHRQLLFRPVFPYFRYRTPVPRLYLCSSYAHPGAGVHGMGGYNAAHAVLEDAA